MSLLESYLEDLDRVALPVGLGCLYCNLQFTGKAQFLNLSTKT